MTVIIVRKRDEQFTYLVPTDKAWAAVKDDMATAHKVRSRMLMMI